MCGFSYVGYAQNFVNIKWLAATENQRSTDQCVQIWAKDVNSSSKGHVYNILKPDIGFEKYINILPEKL